MTLSLTARELMLLCQIVERYDYPEDKALLEEVSLIMDKLLIERERQRKTEE